jgi:predicted Zn-dependent peptidase
MAARSLPMSPAAPVTELIRRVDIPYQEFTLANGLRVLVHEDRKAPVVAVSVWYNVGSKDEPKGKTGFAHLFEHIMFNGSEMRRATSSSRCSRSARPIITAPPASIAPTTSRRCRRGRRSGPVPESDRMGLLLGAVTQEKLDNQIGVVQNEKRQGDNRPGGLVFYKILEELFPEGHPIATRRSDRWRTSIPPACRTSRAGSATNTARTTRCWCWPATSARRRRGRWSRNISGRSSAAGQHPAKASVPVLKAAKAVTMRDRVAATTVSRYWAVPGLLDKQMVALDVGGSVLGGLSSSRLDNALVRDEKIAVSVSAGLSPFQRVGLFSVSATVKPGVDPKLVEKRLDELVAQFVAEGPNAAEVTRAATSEVAGRVRGLEQVGGFGGKAVALAEGAVYAGDPLYYKKTLAQYARPRPPRCARDAAMADQAGAQADARAGEAAEAIRGRWGASRPPRLLRGQARRRAAAGADDVRAPDADVGQLTPLDFPTVLHATLSNGIKIHYAQRRAVPVR